MRPAAAALLAALTATPAWADPPATPPASTVLHLTQSADRKLTRDVLHVELRAEHRGADPQSVESAINQAMAKALAQAKQAPGTEVETGFYSVHRETPSGVAGDWVGSQSLSLRAKDSAALLKLAGTLQDAGLIMSNLTYETSPEAARSVQDALTAEALSALEKRAAAIAGQLRVAVLGYRDLTVGNAESGAPMPRYAVQATMAAAMPEPVGAPGEATVRVTVSAEVLLSPKQP